MIIRLIRLVHPMAEIPIVVVSLTRNHERRAAMYQRFHEMGAVFQFLDAVDGQQQFQDNQVT